MNISHKVLPMPSIEAQEEVARLKLFQIKGGQPNVLFPSVRKRSLVNSRFRPVEETSQSFDQTLCQ